MTASSPQKQQFAQYCARTVTRAERALFCSPFKLTLFKTMRNQSVSLQIIRGATGLEQGYTKQVLSEGQAEGELIWLIQVGLARREVDGQGITDSFRLTPLGRQIIEKWETHQDCSPTFFSLGTATEFLTRWLSITF